ncbi:hypothetical protein [Blastopirellula marina]|uniref:Uncharacterized protein n=1 Tax=Blastopirellula marina TaxID=124 RepID=A0A2S8GPW8_9BACT|nr:hypothetical protein [Blastopirellula marina]PQO46054.1 hypothetical protein C5Y93_10775 [Blastopirellula marina]
MQYNLSQLLPKSPTRIFSVLGALAVVGGAYVLRLTVHDPYVVWWTRDWILLFHFLLALTLIDLVQAWWYVERWNWQGKDQEISLEEFQSDSPDSSRNNWRTEAAKRCVRLSCEDFTSLELKFYDFAVDKMYAELSGLLAIRFRNYLLTSYVISFATLLVFFWKSRSLQLASFDSFDKSYAVLGLGYASAVYFSSLFLWHHAHKILSSWKLAALHFIGRNWAQIPAPISSSAKPVPIDPPVNQPQKPLPKRQVDDDPLAAFLQDDPDQDEAEEYEMSDSGTRSQSSSSSSHSSSFPLDKPMDSPVDVDDDDDLPL